MEKAIEPIHKALKTLVGLHRQLLDVIRNEREALVQADLKKIQEHTLEKEGLIARIRQAEKDRYLATAIMAGEVKKPVEELTLNKIIILVQGTDQRKAETLRSSLSALTFLMTRIKEQNLENRSIVEESLKHIQAMKMNVLGEGAKGSDTYSQKGQRLGKASQARLITGEA